MLSKGNGKGRSEIVQLQETTTSACAACSVLIIPPQALATWRKWIVLQSFRIHLLLSGLDISSSWRTQARSIIAW